MPKDADARYLFGLLLPAASGRMVAALPMSRCPLPGYESDSSYETLSTELVVRDAPLGSQTLFQVACFHRAHVGLYELGNVRCFPNS